MADLAPIFRTNWRSVNRLAMTAAYRARVHNLLGPRTAPTMPASLENL